MMTRKRNICLLVSLLTLEKPGPINLDPGLALLARVFLPDSSSFRSVKVNRFNFRKKNKQFKTKFALPNFIQCSQNELCFQTI